MEGCDIGQGYFLSRPISKENFQQLLENSTIEQLNLVS